LITTFLPSDFVRILRLIEGSQHPTDID
jgi:hypothetical protein